MGNGIVHQQHGCTPSRGPRHQHEVEQDDNGDDGHSP